MNARDRRFQPGMNTQDLRALVVKLEREKAALLSTVAELQEAMRGMADEHRRLRDVAQRVLDREPEGHGWGV